MADFTLSRRGALLAGAEIAALATFARFPQPAEAVAPRLSTFGYQGVRLLPSRWQTQQTDVLNYYMGVPADSYLIGFRKRAGKPAPGTELGGWYTAGDFNCFGQIVSGLARFYAGTGRQDVKAKVNALTAGFKECIGPDGDFFYSAAGRTHYSHYEYDKCLCGMLDAWLYCGDTNGRDAIAPITWWAAANLKRDRPYMGGGEWYTLAENLYRAYLTFGEAGYRDFAQVWEYRGFWDRFHRGEDWFLKPDGTVQDWYHAYSHVNSLNGLGAGYLATGDDRFGDWAEQLLYNGVGASMQSDASGAVQYHCDYATRGGRKFVQQQSRWSCAWRDHNFFYNYSATETEGAAAEVDFEGTGIRFRWQEGTDRGIARVEIDGQLVRTVDQYGPQRDEPARTDVTGLVDGRHTIRVTNTGTKNAASLNTYLNVEKIQALP